MGGQPEKGRRWGTGNIRLGFRSVGGVLEFAIWALEKEYR
jgi:hypothetical protein